MLSFPLPGSKERVSVKFTPLKEEVREAGASIAGGQLNARLRGARMKDCMSLECLGARAGAAEAGRCEEKPELGSPACEPRVPCGRGGGWPSTNGENIRKGTRWENTFQKAASSLCSQLATALLRTQPSRWILVLLYPVNSWCLAAITEIPLTTNRGQS